MAKSGKALGENELNLASGGKVVIDSKNGKDILGYHLYGDVKGEDQGYFTKDEEDQLKAVAKALGTKLDFIKKSDSTVKKTNDSLADQAVNFLSEK